MKGGGKLTALAVRASSIGFSIVGCVLMGIFAGHWLDEHFGTSPLLFFAGLLWGVFGAFWIVFKLVKKMQSQDEENES